MADTSLLTLGTGRAILHIQRLTFSHLPALIRDRVTINVELQKLYRITEKCMQINTKGYR
jgi:hypothetical protein